MSSEHVEPETENVEIVSEQPVLIKKRLSRTQKDWDMMPTSFNSGIKSVFKNEFRKVGTQACIQKETVKYLNSFLKNVIEDIIVFCEGAIKRGGRRITSGLLMSYIAVKFPTIEKLIETKFKKMNIKLNDTNKFRPLMNAIHKPFPKKVVKIRTN